MLKINNSYVKICESSHCLLAVFVSIVTHAIVTGDHDTHTHRHLPVVVVSTTTTKDASSRDDHYNPSATTVSGWRSHGRT